MYPCNFAFVEDLPCSQKLVTKNSIIILQNTSAPELDRKIIVGCDMRRTDTNPMETPLTFNKVIDLKSLKTSIKITKIGCIDDNTIESPSGSNFAAS